MFRRLLRILFVGTSEMVLAVVLALVFSLMFLGILVISFPRGTGLIDFYGEIVEKSRGGGSRRTAGGGPGGEPAIVAVLSEVTRQVRNRPSDAVAWSPAQVGLEIEDRHTIQTLSRSAATINFTERSRLELGENSLVVIKRTESRWDRRRMHPALVVLGGELRGTIDTSAPGTPHVDILTAGASTRIDSDGANSADFRVTVNPDQTSTVALFSGTAEITSAGKTAVIGSNQSVTLTPDQPPPEPKNMPATPRAESPGAGWVKTFGSVTPSIEFGWAAAGADGYRLEIARDPAFEQIEYENLVAEKGLTHGHLDTGTYYWRVAAVSGEVVGRPSAVRSFTLIEDLEPPVLQVELPDEPVASDRLIVRGNTEPDATLLIGGEAVSVNAEGAFEYAMDLTQGMNMIVIETVDAAGNSNYHSQYVNAKF